MMSMMALMIKNIKVLYAADFNAFDNILSNVSSVDVFNALRFRDSDARDFYSVEKQGGAEGSKSNSIISERAKLLIIKFEVSSKSVYQKKYQRPVWPEGESGVTFAIGYDAGYTEASAIIDTWKGLIPENDIIRLSKVAGLKGVSAKESLSNVADITIPWDAAYKQFSEFLPFVIAQTETAFKGAGSLNPDCLGALVSLVYNRGPKTTNNYKRKEMYNISQLLKKGDLDKIPDEILAMRKHWPEPNQRGLIIRRELEALLFRTGLQNDKF